MDIDLLFTAVEQSDWKKVTENGSFEPESLAAKGYIQCFEGKELEKTVNQLFSDCSKITLIVIDPMRIQAPIKHIKENDLQIVAVQGTFSLDAIIDKIKIEKDKSGKFTMSVRHYD